MDAFTVCYSYSLLNWILDVPLCEHYPMRLLKSHNGYPNLFIIRQSLVSAKNQDCLYQEEIARGS